MLLTAPVCAGPTRGTRATRLEDLDRYAIPRADAPSLRSRGADGVDDADGLVTGHEREASEQLAGELLVVRATESTCFDPQPGVVITDSRSIELTSFEPPRCRQDHR